MKFVDAHVHLSDPEYEPHVGQVIEEAKESSVVALVSNSVNLQTSLQSIKLAKEHPKLVYAALGIHPWNVKELLPNELEQTVDIILNHRKREEVLAIGEIGLDYKYVKGEEKEVMAKQYEVFCRMLELSEKLSIPAIIHSRGAALEIMNLLSSYNLKRVLLHWFSSPIESLPEIVERGYYITEGPSTVFSSHTQDIIRRVPLTCLLTETDGPVRYSRPPFKGKMTTPAFIPIVVEAIARIRGEEKLEVAEQICKNFVDFFEVELT